MIYTIGYGQLRNPEDLLSIAENLDTVVADIRIRRTSRNPMWRGGNVDRVLGERVVYIKELGNQNYKGANGSAYIPVDLATGLSRANDVIREHGSIILLCACKGHRYCHRSDVAERLAFANGMDIEHLSQSDINRLLGNGQLDLF